MAPNSFFFYRTEQYHSPMRRLVARSLSYDKPAALRTYADSWLWCCSSSELSSDTTGSTHQPTGFSQRKFKTLLFVDNQTPRSWKLTRRAAARHPASSTKDQTLVDHFSAFGGEICLDAYFLDVPVYLVLLASLARGRRGGEGLEERFYMRPIESATLKPPRLLESSQPL